MDIAALSTAMHMTEIQNQVGVAMLNKSLETMDDISAGMIKMMETSVTPELGQNIDVIV